MKKRIIILSVVLALCTLLSALSACSSESASAVWFQYKDAKITEASYRFWLATTKKDYASSSGGSDTLAFWDKTWESDDGTNVTTAAFIEQMVQRYAKNIAVELQLFKEYKLSLSSSRTETVDKYIDELIFYKYGDSKAAFNDELKKVYGITIDDLRETLLSEAKVQTLESYLFGENGPMAPTAEEKEAYFNEHYVLLQILVINTKKEYLRDETGALMTDELGNYQMRAYTEEERENRIAIAEAALALAQSGENFTDLISLYGDVTGSSHPEGLYLSDEDKSTIVAGGFDAALLDAMFTQEIGSIGRYDKDDEAIYIVKRLPLEEGAYDLSEQSDRFTQFNERVITKKTADLLERYVGDVVVCEDVYKVRLVDIQKGVL